MYKFPAHGEISFEITPPILNITIVGPVNLEGANNYFSRIGAARAKLASSPWASLVKTYNLSMIAHEISHVLIDSIREARKNNLVATSILFDSHEFTDATRQFWSQLYDKTGLTYRFFDNENEAREWLLEQVNNVNKMK